jgi:hypothetical protein
VTNFQSSALEGISVWLLLLATIALAYFLGLKQTVPRKLLASAPSLIFLIAPVVLIAVTPEARFSPAPRIPEDLFVFSYLVATGLIVFNLFYIRTWLHLFQILNLCFAAVTFFLTALIVSGDSM